MIKQIFGFDPLNSVPCDLFSRNPQCLHGLLEMHSGVCIKTHLFKTTLLQIKGQRQWTTSRATSRDKKNKECERQGMKMSQRQERANIRGKLVYKQAIIATSLCDPLMSARPIMLKQNSNSEGFGFFTHCCMPGTGLSCHPQRVSPSQSIRLLNTTSRVNIPGRPQFDIACWMSSVLSIPLVSQNKSRTAHVSLTVRQP